MFHKAMALSRRIDIQGEVATQTAPFRRYSHWAFLLLTGTRISAETALAWPISFLPCQSCREKTTAHLLPARLQRCTREEGRRGTDIHAAAVERLCGESLAGEAARRKRLFVVSQPRTGNLDFNMYIIYSLPGQGTSFLPSLMDLPSPSYCSGLPLFIQHIYQSRFWDPSSAQPERFSY